MLVKLLTNGGYNGTDTCIGKEFIATYHGEGYRISREQLDAAGYVDDGSDMRSLYFHKPEVKVLYDS